MNSVKFRLTHSDKGGILHKVTDHLSSSHREILAAYCFGSFLEHDFSDIDLGLLLDADPDKTTTYEIGLESELEELIPYPFDVRVINQAPISFCQAVIRGRVIIDRDPNRRADFEGKVLKEYFDFAPFRKRYLAEVLNAPL